MKKSLALLAAAPLALGLVAAGQPAAHAAIVVKALNCTYDNQNHPNITGSLSVETLSSGYEVTIDLNDDGITHMWGWNIIRNNVLKDAAYDVSGSFHEVRTYDNGGTFWFRAFNAGSTIDCNAKVTV